MPLTRIGLAAVGDSLLLAALMGVVKIGAALCPTAALLTNPATESKT